MKLLVKDLSIILNNYKGGKCLINPIDLSGRRILITGASSGIGRETAIIASQLGATIIITARREDMLKETISLLEGAGHSFFSYDLKNIDGIEKIVQKIVSENGALDGFVHSAGIGSTRSLIMLKPKFLREIMEVNFYSFVELVRWVTYKGNFNEGLSIVGVSSIASQQGSKGKTAYSASKAALDAAVRCMAKELAPKKIRVNTVVPAWIRTSRFESFLEKSMNFEDAKNDLARQYLGIGEPRDVANMIVYLLSVAASFITGTSVILDGGRLSS
jgi:NAD(P)-dependent dehydrogenase (short-subunit alcohol dehydrogenase family)